MNLLNLIEDQTTGYDNLRALMRAVDTSSKAVLNLGGETVTLEYPEARFMMGKYKAYNKVGRQDEFLRDLGDARQFDLHMKQLRDLIQKQKNFRGSIPGERTVDEQYSAETKKKQSDGTGLTSTSARTDRMLTQLRIKNPQAENDLEALIYDADKQRRRQDRDEIELARLDFENDREEADIARIEKDLQRIKKQRNITEQVKIISGEFRGSQATVIESRRNFITVDIKGFGRCVLHESRLEEMQTRGDRFNITRPILPSGAAKIKYAQDNDMYDDARMQENLRPREHHVTTVRGASTEPMQEDDIDDAMLDYIARGGNIQQEPARMPRLGTRLRQHGSRHIGQGREPKAGQLTGRGANVAKGGKPVVAAESLRDGEYHVATVTLDDGSKHRVKIPYDEGFREMITRHFERKGKKVTDIDVDWSVRSDLEEKKDACYNKVRSRYKVWPSAYASGALVQCRKKGAANWGEGGKKK